MVAFTSEFKCKILNVNEINLINYLIAIKTVCRSINLIIHQLLNLTKSCLKLSACNFIR